MRLAPRYFLLSTVAASLACAGRVGSRAPACETVRVMTYNIHAGHGALDRTLAAIRAADPAVVALQEVDVHWDARSGFADQAAELARGLGMHVRFAPIYSIPDSIPDPRASAPAREFGVALLSQYPIVEFRNDTITRLSTQQPNTRPAPAPGLLEATIEVHGMRVRVFDTHLDYRADPGVRRLQVREMLAYIGASPTRTIVLGDLNATPDAPELAPLLATLRDAWPDSLGAGFTYPAARPAKRIDYVLTSPDIRVRTASVPALDASDHRPVIVDVAFCGNGSTPPPE